MVVLDSSVLLLVLDPTARPPIDPATGQPLDKASQRIEYLIENLTADKEQIVIPTPVLSEVLVHAGDAMTPYLDALNGQAAFRIAPFDQKAAIEAALATSDAIKTKIMFDRQIVAIAKAEGAHAVYSDDADIHRFARRAGLDAYRTADLDPPPEDPQGSLDV